MSDEIVFLFGAGASRGAGHIDPYCPPLMKDLYNQLATYYSDDWGPGTVLATHADKFRENFEETFSKEVLTFDGIPRKSSYAILQSQNTLALYFSRFVLDASGSDYYTALLSALKLSGRLGQCLFASINYDCLFEQAAHKLGFGIDYTANDRNVVRVTKLHGSCNFISNEISQQGKAILSGAGVHYEIGLQYLLPPTDVESRLKQKLLPADQSYFAVMSQISPNKEHFISPAKMTEIRNHWSAAASAAQVIVIIGVSYNSNDTHIVHAISQTPAKVLYIGDDDSFKSWKAANANAEHICKTFEDGFAPLLSALGI